MCSDDGLLDASAKLGRRIVGDAVWHAGRCSWMGAADDPARPWRLSYRPLGPSLYDGTAGVGLVLAELAHATGDSAFGRTGSGALRHAVDRARALPAERRDGFHAGSLGVAWAVARGAALLGDEELHGAARALSVLAAPRSRPGRCPDVIEGSAGAVIGQVALADALDEPGLLEAAVTTGDELLAAARLAARGWSWPVAVGRGRRPLCGVAHGASGIGWALLELFAATGEERFGEAAAGAFAWERSWRDEAAGTWPDLRIAARRHGESEIASPTGATWCHGEAGIALTRLRALDVLGSDAERRDAELALETTRRHLVGLLAVEIDDLTLCHGAAGPADVLLTGAALGGPFRDAASPARELGRMAVDQHRSWGEQWPRGMAAGVTPALFRGLGGIAWWLLRLHDDAIQSPLTVPIRPLTPVSAPT